MALNDKERILSKKVKDRLVPGAHDFTHVVRVMGNAELIVDNDNLDVDYRILYPMILVHDLVRVEGIDESKSVVFSVREAKTLLKECFYQDDSIKKILRGIKSHSLISRGGKIENMVCKPKTIEEKVLFDADKLDALGRVGLSRWFMSRGNTISVGDAAKAYLKIVNDFVNEQGGLYTKSGNSMAKEKYADSYGFLTKLLGDLK
jgi:uncharacterized protein